MIYCFLTDRIKKEEAEKFASRPLLNYLFQDCVELSILEYSKRLLEWEDHKDFCYDSRHEVPCPQPCQACKEECCSKVFLAFKDISGSGPSSPSEYEVVGVCSSFEEVQRIGDYYYFEEWEIDGKRL
jgi:hypothetical protein